MAAPGAWSGTAQAQRSVSAPRTPHPRIKRRCGTCFYLLFYAAHLDEEPGQRLCDVPANPTLRRYVGEWGGRKGDLALLAEDPGGGLLGGVWLRLLVGAEAKLPEFVDLKTPEMGIAVLPGHTRQGIGGRLLHDVIEAGRGRYPAIVLSVREQNPARRLYERDGFVPTSTIKNRIGGHSTKIVRTL